MADGVRYRIDDLRYLMHRLRDATTGCPWDLQQTFATIAPYTLEETCEVIDAIERRDYAHLEEELGDLLFQVVFHSQLAEELGLFNFDDVLRQIIVKLVERHPHVFPAGTLTSCRDPAAAMHSESDIKQTWELIKEKKRGEKGQADRLGDIPNALPALARAAKLQKRAASHGFDWSSAEGVFAKIEEEIAEVRAAMVAGDADHVDEEIGDLLFCCVNLSRHLKVDGEGALRRANREFERRFRSMEQIAAEQGKNFAKLDIAALDELWRQTKLKERSR